MMACIAHAQVTTVVAAKRRHTKNVLLLVDISASMNSQGKIKKAVSALHFVSEQPTDELNLAIIAFNKQFYRWPGFAKAGEKPDGWASLPSKHAVDAAESWLNSLETGHSTKGLLPLIAALGEERDDLTIIFVTDGRLSNESDPNAPPFELLPPQDQPINFPPKDQIYRQSIQRKQKQREAKGLKPAVIGVIQVDTSDQKVINVIVEEGGGGYYRYMADD